MNNLLVITVLVLAVTKVVYSFQFPDLSPFGFMILGAIEVVRQQLISTDCSGFCMPVFLTFLCQHTEENEQCSSKFFTSSCCTFNERLSFKYYQKPSSTCSGQQDDKDTNEANDTLTTRKSSHNTVTDSDSGEKDITTRPPNNKYTVCTGVCVGLYVAKYCEAYLTTSGLCATGQYCCIKDGDVDRRHPDLVVPGEDHTTSRPATADALPSCPGYCLLSIMSTFCERPAVLVANTKCQLAGYVCCDNTSLQNKRPQEENKGS